MRTKRRHELQTNILADYLGRQLQRFRPYSKQLTVGAIILVIAGFGALYYTGAQRTRSGRGWSDFFDAFGARDAKALEEVAKLHAGTKAALWARQSAADIKLATGAGMLFTDRGEAEKTLKDAEKLFLEVEREAGDDQELLHRAWYGLGQVYECLFKLDKARRYYEKRAGAAPDSALGQEAKRRLAQLSDPDMERWYAWFQRQKPAPPTGSAAGGGAAPKVPDNLDELPERPDLPIPSGGGAGTGAKANAEPAGAKSQAPAGPGKGEPAEESAEKPAPAEPTPQSTKPGPP